MVFNSETNNLDLYSEARSWCGIDLTDTTTLALKDFTRSANFGLDRVTSLIFKADGKWQHDDTVQTSELLDTSVNLVSGTSKYAIPVTWLKIYGVWIRTSDGKLKKLKQRDRTEWSNDQLNSSSGEPDEYDLLGNWLYLDKAPNYSYSAGLIVQFERGPSYFVYTDTTKTPGFASHFHRLIALYGALDYCEKNDLDKRSAKIRLKIGNPPSETQAGSGLEGELVDHYANRDVDDGLRISVAGEDYGQSALGSDSGFTSNNPDGF